VQFSTYTYTYGHAAVPCFVAPVSCNSRVIA
jgi:hypothetical protein